MSFPRVGHALKLGPQYCPLVKKKGQYLHCHYEVQLWTAIFHALWLNFLWHFSCQAMLTKFLAKLHDYFEPMLQTQNKGCNCHLGFKLSFSLCLVIESHQRGGRGADIQGMPFSILIRWHVFVYQLAHALMGVGLPTYVQWWVCLPNWLVLCFLMMINLCQWC